MTAAELFKLFRVRVDDTANPPLYSNETLLIYLNLAETEAAIRAKLLYDTSNKAIVSGTSRYALDDGIFNVDNALLTDASGNKKTLTLTDKETLDKLIPLWREAANGEPKYLIVNESSVELTPTPNAAYTLTLNYYRTPKYAMVNINDEPEINVRHHDGLIDWMIKLAKDTVDVDNGNQAMSSESEQRFIRRFGIRQDANVLRKQARKGARTTNPIRF